MFFAYLRLWISLWNFGSRLPLQANAPTAVRTTTARIGVIELYNGRELRANFHIAMTTWSGYESNARWFAPRIQLRLVVLIKATNVRVVIGRTPDDLAPNGLTSEIQGGAPETGISENGNVLTTQSEFYQYYFGPPHLPRKGDYAISPPS